MEQLARRLADKLAGSLQLKAEWADRPFESELMSEQPAKEL